MGLQWFNKGLLYITIDICVGLELSEMLTVLVDCMIVFHLNGNHYTQSAKLRARCLIAFFVPIFSFIYFFCLFVCFVFRNYWRYSEPT